MAMREARYWSSPAKPVEGMERGLLESGLGGLLGEGGEAKGEDQYEPDGSARERTWNHLFIPFERSESILQAGPAPNSAICIPDRMS